MTWNIYYEKLAINQRVLILKTFYQNQSSITDCDDEKVTCNFWEKNVPTERNIYRVINDFEERGSVGDRPKHAKNITDAKESVKNNPSTSIRHRAQELGPQRTTLATILHKDLHSFPFKIQLTHRMLLLAHQ